MEVSQEVIPRPTGKAGKSGIVDVPDKVDDIFWDAHWTLDDDDQQPEPSFALL